jgi:hypothetical protein
MDRDQAEQLRNRLYLLKTHLERLIAALTGKRSLVGALLVANLEDILNILKQCIKIAEGRD